MTEVKSNHRANVIRVPEPRVHTNADTLELIDIPDTTYQVVVKKGQFKAGDLAVYIQPDSVVPQTAPFKFIWEPYVDVLACAALGEAIPEVPERRRRITVRKFRKEWSEGLLLPLSDFLVQAVDGQFRLMSVETGETTTLKPGDDVSTLLGITHYDPDKGKELTTGENERGPSTVRRWPKSLKGWFHFLLHKVGIRLNGNTHGWDREGSPMPVKIYDVEALKNYKNTFILGEQVTVTEKIHGSNARFVFVNGKQFVGSRTLWKSDKSDCVWRKALAQHPWIGTWCQANEGSVLYGEVVPTQGDEFLYGCQKGEVKFFPFDIRTKEGEWQKPYLQQDFIGLTPPLLYQGPYDPDKILPLVDGKSLVDGKTLREGVVINTTTERHERGLGRVQLKIVSNAFLEKESKR